MERQEGKKKEKGLAAPGPKGDGPHLSPKKGDQHKRKRERSWGMRGRLGQQKKERRAPGDARKASFSWSWRQRLTAPAPLKKGKS